MSSTEPPRCFLVGVTASGKSRLALELAAHARAELLSLDSMQLYKRMDIGTAKPSASERARVPHHLLDLVEPWEEYDVQRFVARAEQELGLLRERAQRALFVGGTGLYLKSLTHGLFEGPRSDPQLRESLVQRAHSEGLAALHAELARRDPESALRIHPNDEKRVVRALEVLEQTGEPLSHWQSQWRDASGAARGGQARCMLGLELAPQLQEARFEVRVRAMFRCGWAEEALAIQAAGGFSRSAVQALGYVEALAVARGELPLEQAVQSVVLQTRQFARRQRTWFRQDSQIHWIDASLPLEQQLELALEHLGW